LIQFKKIDNLTQIEAIPFTLQPADSLEPP
jgi:hypothetical protein